VSNVAESVPAPDARPMIAIEHVSKAFGAVRAVADLTLRVPAGELFCFLGPNGAGKTTTIRMLTGLLRPDSGRVSIGGFDLQTEPVAAKRLLGYIPDVPYMYERLTPVEFIRFVADMYGTPDEKVRDALASTFKDFGLEPYSRELAGNLSHGMRQRLMYVATLLHEPRAMLIDEPFVGLDPYSIRMIKDLLVAKARQGMAIFLTTHILALAEEIADRVGIIHRGSLAALGSVPDLLRDAGADANLEDVFLGLTTGDSPEQARR
jgi:ABC-2 type transport system ATP-binding protein